MNYMSFQVPRLQGDTAHSVGDTVRVSTFAGSGAIAQIHRLDPDGRVLKMLSGDGLRTFTKTVPYWVGMERAETTLPEVAARRFWASGCTHVWHANHRPTLHPATFIRWEELAEFVAICGDPGLFAFLCLAAALLTFKRN
mgnify:CR=1 FL=1